MEERLDVLWLQSPVKLWLNGSSLRTVLSLPCFWSRRVSVWCAHAVPGVKLLSSSSAVLVELPPCSPHSRVAAVSARGEVAACALKGSCNPALLLPALLGRVPALSVNKLFIYFPHSSFNFFFPLLLSTCVQSMCSKNMCSSKVLWLWKPGIQVCITLQCSENALGSPRGIISFFVPYCRMYLPWLKLLFFQKKFLPF